MKTKATYHKAALIALTLALAAFALSGCGNAGGGGQGGGGGGPTITVGSKNFTEQFVLGELYSQTLEANGFTAEHQLNLGSEQLADEALQSGEIDFYPEYTGTALVALLGYEGENYPGLDEFEDTIVANDLGLRYQGVENGEADVGVGFLTDGQLTSEELVVLEDEKSIWPFYNPAPVVRNDVLEENPEVEEILNSVTEILNVDAIRELNGRVDIEGEDPEDVAEDFLRQQGLI